MDLEDQTDIPAGSTENPTTDSSPVEIDSSTVRVISSQEIFQGDREVRIQHDENVYRLRMTRKGKLILHK